MADWQVARVSAVFTTTDPLYAWVKLVEQDQPTWRKIEPRSADGCSNVFQVAVGAWVRDHDYVMYLVNGAGEVTAISNFLV